MRHIDSRFVVERQCPVLATRHWVQGIICKSSFPFQRSCARLQKAGCRSNKEPTHKEEDSAALMTTPQHHALQPRCTCANNNKDPGNKEGSNWQQRHEANLHPQSQSRNPGHKYECCATEPATTTTTIPERLGLRYRQSRRGHRHSCWLSRQLYAFF